MARNQKVVTVSVNQVNARLVKEDGFLEKAILLLFSRQVQVDEQVIARTVHKNDIGFNKSNAKKGTELAQALLKWQDAEKEGAHPWSSADRSRARSIAFTHAVQVSRLLDEHANK